MGPVFGNGRKRRRGLERRCCHAGLFSDVLRCGSLDWLGRSAWSGPHSTAPGMICRSTCRNKQAFRVHDLSPTYLVPVRPPPACRPPGLAGINPFDGYVPSVPHGVKLDFAGDEYTQVGRAPHGFGAWGSGLGPGVLG